MNASWQDGKPYEPDTLTSINRSFDRYLIKDVCKNYSIIQGLEFTSSRETLKAKRKYLKFFGKGNKPEACESLRESEIEQLWTSNALGDHFPQNLKYTIWFLMCLHMGMRGRGEPHLYTFSTFDINTTSVKKISQK